MAKTYDLGNKADMRRFERDFEKAALDVAKAKIQKEGFDYECPFCERTITVKLGKNECPYCENVINIEF